MQAQNKTTHLKFKYLNILFIYFPLTHHETILKTYYTYADGTFYLNTNGTWLEITSNYACVPKSQNSLPRTSRHHQSGKPKDGNILHRPTPS